MHDNPRFDIDRIVTGQASIAEENAFLARCEAEPEYYRHLSLSLIEQRQLETILLDGPLPADIPRSDRLNGSARRTFVLAACVMVVGCVTAAFQLGARYGEQFSQNARSLDVAQRSSQSDGRVIKESTVEPDYSLPIVDEDVIVNAPEPGSLIIDEETQVVFSRDDQGDWRWVPETTYRIRKTASLAGF